MPPLLPPITDHDAFRRLHGAGVDFWRPALDEIARRHGFAAGAITRFPAGDNPVFACEGTVVIKLVPPLWSDVARREIAMLAILAPDAAVSAPQLIGHGTIDDWHYVASTLMPGEGLHVVWPRLTRGEQEQLARDCGAVLRALHALPANAIPTGTFPDWNEWLRQAVTTWPTRWGLQRVPAPLRDDGARFLAAAGLGDPLQSPYTWCALHGDFAPINTLVAKQDGAWRISGLIDFGNSGFGDPVFDYTAPTILLQPGDAGIVQRFFAGLERTFSPNAFPAVRRRLMAYTLLHPMGDLSDCLDLLPAARTCTTWDEVAALFWPDLP